MSFTILFYSAEVFDPRVQAWNMIATMSTRRSSVGSFITNSCHKITIFFVSLQFNEFQFEFQCKRRCWSGQGSPLCSRRLISRKQVSPNSSCDCTNLGFLTIGYDGASRQCLSSVERYDVQTDTWTPVAEMNCRRSGAGVGVLDNILYAVGGNFLSS